MLFWRICWVFYLQFPRIVQNLFTETFYAVFLDSKADFVIVVVSFLHSTVLFISFVSRRYAAMSVLWFLNRKIF